MSGRGSDDGRGLDRLARRWAQRRLAADALGAAAVALPVATLGATRFGSGAAAIVACAALALLGLAGSLRGRWRPRPEAVARHLDRVVPELEESSELLLGASHRGLAGVQRRRVERAFERLPRGGRLPTKPLIRSAAALAAAGVASLGLLAVAGRRAEPVRARADFAAGERLTAPAPTPLLAGIRVQIVPPPYTGRAPRAAAGLELEVEEGSRVTWTLTSEPVADSAGLIFDEIETVPLSGEGAAGRFTGSLHAVESRLYRVALYRDGEEVFTSPAARLAVRPDRPPRVEVIAPADRWSMPQRTGGSLTVEAGVEDDLGIEDVALVATLASGSGELVRFRERRLPMVRITRAPAERAGASELAAADLDLAALGLEPGTELYLIVEARDSRRPEPQIGRSRTVIVRMPGARAAAAGLGEGLPILELPQAFRSQRQIILDTERLLAKSAVLAPSEVASRSESLGFDQRALRMRYAALLGEELESGSPLGDAGGGLGEAPVRGTDAREAPENLPDGFFHSHDSAEVATYFGDELKATLKRAMAEMWGAEGLLRVHDPRRALPYEYRALRHLKAAQEAERVYVRKVGFQPPPLDFARRLTGDRSEVKSPQRRWPRENPAVPAALTALEELRKGAHGAPTGDAARAIEEVARELARRTARGEAPEGAARVDALRRWLAGAGAPGPEEAARLEGLLWALLPSPEATPGRRPEATSALLEAYLRRLDGER